MDHPEVRAWLEEAALTPGGVNEPADRDVAAHLDVCAECSTERDALQAVAVALGVAIGPSRGARERTLAAVAQLGRDRRTTSRVPAYAAAERRAARAAATASPGRLAWRTPRLSVPAAAAALGVAALVFVAGALVGAFAARPADQPSRLPALASLMGELIVDPASNAVPLRDDGGQHAGVVVHNRVRDRLVVMTSALTKPETGRYSCYLEREAERVPIGPMHFEEDTAFWAGPMSGPDDAGRPGDRFLVILDGSDGRPVLVGEF